jgi:hypothetical protein
MIIDWHSEGNVINYTLGPITNESAMAYNGFYWKNDGNFYIAHIHFNHLEPQKREMRFRFEGSRVYHPSYLFSLFHLTDIYS